jgi:hypothetical protein
LNKSNNFYITANGKKFLSMIERFRQEYSLQIEYCYLMEIDRLKLEEAKSKLKNLPQGLNFIFYYYYYLFLFK